MILPEGWGEVSFGAACSLNPPKPLPDHLPSDEPVSFVPMPSVDAEAGAITDNKTRTYSSVRKGYTYFANGDVIFAKITPCMENGKAAVATNLTNGIGFGSTEFHVLRSVGATDPLYIYYFLRQEVFRREAENYMTGSVGQRRVPIDFLKSYTFPLPPLAEQKRIVAKVDELLTQVKAARKRLEKVPTILNRFRQSVLAAACSGRLTEDWRKGNDSDEEWAIGTIQDAILNLDQGWSPKCENHPAAERNWGVIKTTSVQPIKFLQEENKELPAALEPRPQLCLEDGDILITRAGPRVRCAITCFVENPRDRLMICDKVYRIRINPDFIDGKYITFLLNSPEYLEILEAMKTGTSDSGMNITQRGLLEMEIPLPLLEEQQEIVRRVGALFNLADAIDRRVESVRTKVEKTTQAILAKAFRGELVLTEAKLARKEGRDYEPAAVLLGRIREEREQVGEGKSKKMGRRGG